MLRRLGDLADPFAPFDPRTPPSHVWPYLLSQLRPFRAIMAASLLFTVIGAALEVLLIYYTGRLVDTLAETSPDRFWAEHGAELLGVAILVIVVRPLAWLGREGLNDLAFRPNAITQMQWRSHRHISGQSVGWFQNDLTGRVATRVRQIGDSAAGAAYTVLHTLSFVTLYILGSFWLLASVDARLVTPLVIWVAIYISLMLYVVPRFRDASERYQEAQSALTGTLVDTYANVSTFKLFAGDEAGDVEGREQFENARAAHINRQRIEVIINVGMMTLATLLMVALVGYSIVLWQAGDTQIGIVAAALALSLRISGMAEWLLDAVASLFGYVGATREALKTIAQPVDVLDEPGAPDLVTSGGAIQLSGISHHYGAGDGGLDNVSLEIRPGEKVGLVGRSGAGKSTLVNLLLRFHDLEHGCIEIDGQDIRAVTQSSLRRHIAMVAQDIALLNRSVRENIAVGMQGVTDADIVEAARQAEADGFIAHLVDRDGRTGYDAHIGERGVRLSGGQRQRIALARAILKDAPILVLDEATSALDSEVEATIQDSLYRLMEGKTVIAIAHRLSTIAHMDRIVVLDEGRVVEDGRHEDLLRSGGIYADLWARQSGGFIGV